MKSKIFVSIIGISVLCFLAILVTTPMKINASKVVDLVQGNYKSITVNDKYIVSETSNQYLIDDFIPKLSRFALKTYEGELPKESNYKVNIISKHGSQITLYDNNYLVVDNHRYKILEGSIDLDKLYTVFMN